MTTRLELAECYQSGKGAVSWISKERRVIAELPDEKGVHETSVGRIGLDFGTTVHKTGTSHEVLLDVGEAKVLQSRLNRRSRRVEIGTTHLLNNHTVLFAYSDRERWRFDGSVRQKWRR